MLESKYVKQQLLQAQVSTTPANIFTKPPRCSHTSNPSTLYPNVVTYKCDGSYTGHMHPGGHRTDIPAIYCQFQSLDRQLGSSVSWELQNKANILLRAQQIWKDSVTLLVMYIETSQHKQDKAYASRRCSTGPSTALLDGKCCNDSTMTGSSHSMTPRSQATFSHGHY